MSCQLEIEDEPSLDEYHDPCATESTGEPAQPMPEFAGIQLETAPPIWCLTERIGVGETFHRVAGDRGLQVAGWQVGKMVGRCSSYPDGLVESEPPHFLGIIL
jgi:hypothetical protein